MPSSCATAKLATATVGFAPIPPPASSARARSTVNLPNANPAATNRAQTSIVSHAGKILALYEASLPTEVNTKLKTIGRYDFGGALRSPMTAHPKIDPVTGEMLFFGYDLFGPPYLRFHVADRHGKLVLSKEITIPRATMMHDFAITERHVVFLDLPVVYDLSTFGKRPFPAQWKPEYGARIGVMPRDASTAPRWFEIEPCYVFHTVNAYDEGETVVLDVVRHEQMFVDDLYGVGDGTGTLDRWTIDLRAGRVREQRIDDRTQEFPRVDPRTVGRRHRYAYTTTARLGDFVEPFGTLLQHDLKSGTTTAAKLGPGRQAGEGVFVPAERDGRRGRGMGALRRLQRDRGPERSRDPGRDELRRRSGRDGRASPARSLRVPRHLGTVAGDLTTEGASAR